MFATMSSCEDSEGVQATMHADWSTTCRTCLHFGETRSLFEQDPNALLSLADKVMLCTNMIIREDDNLPDRICTQCIEELEVAYRFRVNCDSSDAILQSYMDGAEDGKSSSEVEPLAPSVGADSQMDECKEEIAIPLDSGVLYTYKPPSGLNVKLIQRPVNSAAVSPVPSVRRLQSVPMYVNNDVNELDRDNVIDSEENEYDEALISEVDSQAAPLHDLPAECTTENGDIKIERLDESDTESYTYEKVVDSSNDMMLVEVTDTTGDPFEMPDDTHSTKGDGGEPLRRNFATPMAKSVRTLQTIRKTNTPNEVKPTIDAVTTQTAADGNGTETVIRIKRNLSSAKQSQHLCEICNTTYKHKHALDTHLRRHRGDRPYKCEHCDKAFVVPFELRRHTRIHTGHKPYKCQYCDRAYSDFGSKTKHERTHTGERPYRCNYCSKTFSYSHVLNSHLLIHTGEKKYSCSTCGKRFTKSHHLKGHQRMHLSVSAKTPEDEPSAAAAVVNLTNQAQELPDALTMDGECMGSKDDCTPTVIMMHEQTEQGLVDSFVNATRLAGAGWTLTDVGLPLSDAATESGAADDGVSTMAANSVVTIGAEELGNVSIVSFNDYMIKTEAIERLMMHAGGDASATEVSTGGHQHVLVDPLPDYVTVLLPKADSALVDAGFGSMEIIDG